MDKRLSSFYLTMFLILLSIPIVGLPPGTFTNRIEGAVYDPEHHPVRDVWVELLNEVGSPLTRTRTNSAGRFTFAGLTTGKFFVKVLPFGTNYKEETQEVYLENVTLGNTDISYVDFYLVVDKTASEEKEGSPGAVFVQDVPASAKQLYEQGLEELQKNRPDSAYSKFEDALKIFPTYFAALNVLGKEYVVRKEFEKAYPYLMRAIDINPRSFSCYFRLAYSFYQIKQYPAAIEAARASVILSPDSIDAYLLYGKGLRSEGKYPESEKVLLKANALAKSKNGEVHYELALLYNRLNRNQDAITELETFLKLVPNSPEKNRIQALIVKLKASASK